MHGPPGVGKSTFAAGSEEHVFVDVEQRTKHIDVNARFEPKSWDEVLQFIGEVYTGKQFKTVVIDTLDHLELMLWKQLCDRERCETIEEVAGGYGKGYRAALEQWRRFMNGLEALRSVGISTVMLAHSHVKEYKNPAGENYDQYQMKLHALAREFLREKADAVGFAGFEDIAKKSKKHDPKAKAITTGERFLSFKHDPAFETKKGIELPDEIPLSWAALAAALTSKQGS